MTISKRKVVVEKKVILTLTLFAALISSTASTLVFVLEQQYKQAYSHSEKKGKDEEVMTQDLADDAVTGDKIEDSAAELSVETRA
jgi:Na+-translocating ferredoxin:NAD+ oxidoreductase RnfG subunit